VRVNYASFRIKNLFGAKGQPIISRLRKEALLRLGSLSN
jgi:hypothetical protein